MLRGLLSVVHRTVLLLLHEGACSFSSPSSVVASEAQEWQVTPC